MPRLTDCSIKSHSRSITARLPPAGVVLELKEDGALRREVRLWGGRPVAVVFFLAFSHFLVVVGRASRNSLVTVYRIHSLLTMTTPNSGGNKEWVSVVGHFRFYGIFLPKPADQPEP